MEHHPEQKALVILGSQWGDEGKGKIVDLLAKDMQVVGRCGGGSNAGSFACSGLPTALDLFVAIICAMPLHQMWTLLR